MASKKVQPLSNWSVKLSSGEWIKDVEAADGRKAMAKVNKQLADESRSDVEAVSCSRIIAC